MASFDISPVERFARPGAVIKRPTEITCFSWDASHTLHHDARSLKYYYTPPLDVSLSDGFESFQKFDDTLKDEHLDALLAALVQLEKRNGGEKTLADFVTWRGMMTKIMTAPYSNFDGFEMNATYYQGTIYIEESKSYKAESRAKESTQKPRPGMPGMDLMSYWGYKFETLCMLPQPWDETSRDYIEDRPNHIVSNYEQYCSIVRTGIGETKLILGGEVDGVWDIKPSDSSLKTNWVELKTSADIRSDNDALKFERKLNKFWAQSFLLGVPKIIVGFRTNDPAGRLIRVQEFETTKIPGVVRNQGRRSWDSNICINFAADFLNFLKNTITGDGVWKIRRQERSPVIEVVKDTESGTGEILSSEFLAWREREENLEAEKEALLKRLIPP